MNTLRSILKPVASLRLTVILLSLSMLLIFAGTLAQRHSGIETVKHQYFHTWGTWIELQNLLPFVEAKVPGGFPMPGGWSLIILLLVNLMTAHALRFKFKPQDLLLLPLLAGALGLLWVWQGRPSDVLLAGSIVVGIAFCVGLYLVHAKRAGVIIIHLGLIFLLLGEFITSVFQVESQMSIEEGSYANYSQDVREAELAIIDRSPSTHDNVVAVPQAKLSREGKVITDPKLPFEIEVKSWYRNSQAIPASQVPPGVPTATINGTPRGVANARPVAGVGDEASKVDAPSAFVTFRKNGMTIGSYLVSLLVDQQTVEVDGKTYVIELRFRRHYKPFQLHLKDFSFDRYVGTELAKNYSSTVRLVDPAKGVDREVRIWMNHPLRYGGETYYQSSFTPDERATVLQVVRNPGWLMPYFSCAIVALGLLLHFTMVLVAFLGRQISATPNPAPAVAAVPPAPNYGKGKKGNARRKGGPGPVSPPALPGSRYTLQPQPLFLRGGVLFPVAMACLTLFGVLLAARQPKYLRNQPSSSRFDFDGFSRLPISFEGRAMPMESLARDTMKVIAEQETFYVYDQAWTRQNADDRTKTAKPQVQLLLDLMTGSDARGDYELFRIKDSEILGFLNLEEKQRRYSLKQIVAHGDELQHQLGPLYNKRRLKQPLTRYEQHLLELGDNIMRVQALERAPDLYVIPPLAKGEEWRTFNELRQAGQAQSHPAAAAFVRILTAYRDNDAATFNSEVRSYRQLLDEKAPPGTAATGLEVFMRRFEPFHLAMWLYAFAFLLGSLSWLGWSVPLRRGAMAVLLITFSVHSLAMIARIVISGRPPVTTLYTSAIFIGWGAIAVAILLEFLTRKAIATAVASVIGFMTLIVAHYLYMSEGDTMRQLQAVLDTNFWLWTHVLTVTMGYAATFLAGVLAIAFVMGGILTKAFSADGRKFMGKMIYGVVCFATFFSFVGTVLGGIWADQSWGRFWGWDPKENGAILIVAWNALVLHARWAGLVRERGVAVLAILGNVVTIWSWFGTNMMGVGLHSYGFMAGAVFWLLVAVAAHLIIAGVGLIPTRNWKSYEDGPGGPKKAVLAPTGRFPVIPITSTQS